jgi:hypothetical protein
MAAGRRSRSRGPLACPSRDVSWRREATGSDIWTHLKLGRPAQPSGKTDGQLGVPFLSTGMVLIFPAASIEPLNRLGHWTGDPRYC